MICSVSVELNIIWNFMINVTNITLIQSAIVTLTNFWDFISLIFHQKLVVTGLPLINLCEKYWVRINTKLHNFKNENDMQQVRTTRIYMQIIGYHTYAVFLAFFFWNRHAKKVITMKLVTVRYFEKISMCPTKEDHQIDS